MSAARSGACRGRGAAWRVAGVVATMVFAVLSTLIFEVSAVGATSYVPVYGEGSSWSANALNEWISDVQQFGMRIQYTADGSTAGRQDYILGKTDFAASDIPFQTNPGDGSAPETPQANSYAYMPITAGGTVFMYNLTIDGQRVTNLRLSGENIAKIFTGAITNWDNPALAADNPGLTLPNESIVPVVRSDGAGSSYELSEWMINQYPSLWNSYCSASGRAPACGADLLLPDGHRDDRPVRRPRRGRVRLCRLRQRIHRLRRVLLRPQRPLPGGPDAQRSRLLHRADAPERGRVAPVGPGGHHRRQAIPPSTSPRTSRASTPTPTPAPTRCRPTAT